MSELQALPAAGPDKKVVTEQVLGELLRLMDLPGRLELKDAPDGGISVAVFFHEEQPAAPAGKRSQVIDALQLLLNKIVNRPQTERRWISLGVGAHPEPRTPAPPRAGAAQAPRPSGPHASSPQGPRASAPAARPASSGPRPPPRGAAPGQRPPPPMRPAAIDEAQLEVPADPAFTHLGRSLAERSARLGRFYAVTLLKPEERARLLQATQGLPGLSVRSEGEGNARRLLFTPDQPTPMPKKAIPDYGDDDEA